MELLNLIDAHHHLWRYNDCDYVWMTGGMASLRRDFLTADLNAVTCQSAVLGTVAVQARQSTRETEWLLDLAKHNSIILGVVGWVPLISESVSDDLQRFALNPKFKA